MQLLRAHAHRMGWMTFGEAFKCPAQLGLRCGHLRQTVQNLKPFDDVAVMVERAVGECANGARIGLLAQGDDGAHARLAQGMAQGVDQAVGVGRVAGVVIEVGAAVGADAGIERNLGEAPSAVLEGTAFSHDGPPNLNETQGRKAEIDSQSAEQPHWADQDTICPAGTIS